MCVRLRARSAHRRPHVFAGVIGVCVVSAAVVLPPQLGMAAYFMLVVVGQLSASLVLEQLGALGLEQTDATATRALAVCLALAGCACTVYKRQPGDAASPSDSPVFTSRPAICRGP